MRYSIISSSVGGLPGPRRTAASISAQPSLCDTVTIACISLHSDSSVIANNSRLCRRHHSVLSGNELGAALPKARMKGSASFAEEALPVDGAELEGVVPRRHGRHFITAETCGRFLCFVAGAARCASALIGLRCATRAVHTDAFQSMASPVSGAKMSKDGWPAKLGASGRNTLASTQRFALRGAVRSRNAE